MKKKIKTEAFVLSKKALPNQDTIVHLFTKEEGKLRVFAKGARRITSRRSPHLQTGNLLEVMLGGSHSKYYLQETTLLSGFSLLRNDSSKYTYLYRMLFVIDRLLPEEQKEDELYKLVKHFFIELSQTHQFSEKSLTGYLNHLLLILGYSDREKTPDEAVFVIEELIHQKVPKISL